MEIPVQKQGRLDVFLVENVPHMSRAKARELTEAGQVRVNGKRARKSHLVAIGDVVKVESEPSPTDFSPLPNASLPLDVLFEDASFVVVNKPAGMPTHPLRAEENNTLVNALVARYPEMAGVGYKHREPGILHRLDTDTSGVVLAARDAATFDALRVALREGRIDKTYVALVEGFASAPRMLDGALVPDRKKVKVLDESNPFDANARPAQTTLVDSKQRGAFSEVVARAPRAGRHQVRAHLAHAGHPLAGDLLYGGPAISGLSRHFLHAANISFLHPHTGKRVSVDSPLPSELQSVLNALG